MSDATDDPVDGLILCGGKASRLGGCDKGLLPYGNKTAVAHTADTLRPLCGRIFVSANRNTARYRDLEIGPVIHDRRRGFHGPLAAFEALVEHAPAPLLLVLPCDLPGLCSDVCARLLAELRGNPSLDVVYATTSSDAFYLCAALRSRCLAGVSARLDLGEGAVRHWLAQLNTRALAFEGAQAVGLRNLNRPEDWPGLR